MYPAGSPPGTASSDFLASTCLPAWPPFQAVSPSVLRAILYIMWSFHVREAKAQRGKAARAQMHSRLLLTGFLFLIPDCAVIEL